ncbi:MAG: META domain-containing protein [Bacteroidales bacterium]|nr:META domain-containing protein [Bacteroidales bacterium]
MRKTSFLAMIAIAGLAACGNAPKSNENEVVAAETIEVVEETPTQTLDNLSFVIIELNGTPLEVGKVDSEENIPHIAFAEGNVNASVGCNQLNAAYTVGENGAIAFEMAALTKMACPEGSREDEFIEAFNKVVAYKYDGCEISFVDADGNLLFKGKQS